MLLHKCTLLCQPVHTCLHLSHRKSISVKNLNRSIQQFSSLNSTLQHHIKYFRVLILGWKSRISAKLEFFLQKEKEISCHFLQLHLFSNHDHFSPFLINQRTVVRMFILDPITIIKCEHYSSPIMTSLFFAVIFVPLACARTLQGWGDHRGVTLVWLWFLDQALGPRLGVHFKYSPASLLSTLHFTGATKRPHCGVERHSLQFPLHWDCGD